MATATLRRGVVLGLFVLGCAPDDRGSGFQPYTTSAATIGSADDGAQEDSSSGGTDEGTDDAASSPAQDGPADDDAPADDDTADDGGATTEGGAASETGSGDPVLDGCLAMAVDACQECACNLCLDPLYACQQDVGCVAMRDCADMTGCATPEACYEACMGVIEMYGGPFGDSATLALELAECLQPSCPICF